MGPNPLIIRVSYKKDVPEYRFADVSYLAHILRADGYSAELYDIYRAWSDISDDYCAGWLMPEAYSSDEVTSMLLSKLNY